MADYEQMKVVLQALRQAMKSSGEWSVIAISPCALKSQQPFCLDTMNFSQWLQFVFIPKIQAIIEANQTLPKFIKGQGLEPMASEFYGGVEASKRVVSLIRQVDSLLQQ